MTNRYRLHAIVQLYGDRATDHVELYEDYGSRETAHEAKEQTANNIKCAVDKAGDPPPISPLTILICGGIFRPEEIRYAKLWVSEVPSCSESGGDEE